MIAHSNSPASSLSMRPVKNRAALFVGTALAIGLLAGCSTTGMTARTNAASRAQTALTKGDTAKAIKLAEAAVAANPQDAALRVLLGQAYLKAGRFQSATTTFDDAMKLGDNSARNALSLALAKTGAGDLQGALAVLDDWRGEIPAGDLGLALALAGEPERGVAVLADALRSGDNTPKIRQNLAYAYALAGQWREARTMAAQDVPGDVLGDRMTEWASTIRPEQHQARVAALLGTPLRGDSGQPAALALVNNPTMEQLATQTTADPAAPVVTPEPARPAIAAASELPTELPAAAPESAAPAPVLADATPVTAIPQAMIVEPEQVVATAPANSANQVRFYSEPVIQTVMARPARVSVRNTVKAAPTKAQGTHLVQLGSFASQQGARRAWGIYTARDASLANYRMTIAPAVVRGQTVWRVAAGGISGSGAATGLCNQVKNHGGACFAYAGKAQNMAPAAVPGGPVQDVSGPQRARRR
ncbi:MAG: tetratricopeptide repeat protein [Novosphingobium sp.]